LEPRSASFPGIEVSRRHRDLLDGLPLTVTVDVDGLGPAVFCHASPRRDDEMLLADSPMQRWEAALSGLDAGIQTVVCGHTHMQFDRLAAGRRVVNPGSVGMPYGPAGPAGAHWALLGPGTWLRRTRYDTAAAATVIAAGRHLSAGVGPRERAPPHLRRRSPCGIHRDRPPAGKPGPVTARSARPN
jgi:diadenosine tetraphosphatase ApaH/serine/threonine PP2A family protein phosphatase